MPMTTLLQLNSSIHNGSGQSSQLAKRFVAAFKSWHPDTEVIERDLAGATAIPRLTAERFAAFLAKPESRTAAQHADVAYSDALIEELRRADVIVLGLPLYNFGVPSSLKAYFDHVALVVINTASTEKGPVGLL